jgi:hypothetical protein
VNVPVFVDADEGLLLFRSAEKLAVTADPDDVQSGAYGAAFDWDGRRLDLEVVRERRSGLGGAPVVVVGLADGEREPDVEGLKELLDRALGLMGEVDELTVLRRDALVRFGVR